VSIALDISDGWLMVLKLGGSAYAAGLFTGLTIAAAVAIRMLGSKSDP
jgi:hypothetical protein